MPNGNPLHRREFMRRAGAVAMAAGSRPIWSWSTQKNGAPVGAERQTGRWTGIPTREFYGDTEERLEVPPSWNLKVQLMAGHERPVLQAHEIRHRIQSPLGAKRLADLARGKRTAVITFDDLTRPTPSLEALPAVIEELKLGGIRDDGILFLTSYGSHRPMVQDEVLQKLGPETAYKYPWVNHNIYENLVDVGRTSRGNRIMINRHFAEADLRITISGIKAHGTAGYGGGAKAVLPGVAWIESIHYFHRTIAGVGGNSNTSVGMFKIFRNECRLDMVEAARLARADFSVQILYNGNRKVIGLHAGDIVEAHHAACREAVGLLRTEQSKDADLVILNAYPQNLQATNTLHWARTGLRDGGTAVLIIQNPQGLQTMHYASERWSYDARPYYETAHPSKWQVKQAGQMIVYSAYLQKRDMVQFPSGTVFTRTWADTVEAVRKAQRGDVQAALYPYAGIQHPPGELDEIQTARL